MKDSLLLIAKQAKSVSKHLRSLSTEKKNQALQHIANELAEHKESILEANALDLKQADVAEHMRDRLSLKGRLDEMISEVHHVSRLPDPIGKVLESTQRSDGLKLSKIQVPIGVLGIIYESRPNVTVDAASLALKSGNCAILRGGKETLNTNLALIKAIQTALKKTDLPAEAIQLISSPDRAYLHEFVKLDRYIDLLIPRGGEKLHRFCLEEGTIPVITGGMGICHLYVDESADLEKSIDVIVNAKTQRPSVCNSLDTLLIHKNIATSFLPAIVAQLQAKEVTFRLDPKAWALLNPTNTHIFQKAEDQDWQTEWLRLVLGIKIVDSLDEALLHIQNYSTQHSDGILTSSTQNAQKFIVAIDSAAIYVNASTRFTDGAQFGLGSEVAVSTQKLHARGPMGLNELTSYKWVIEGNYNIRHT